MVTDSELERDCERLSKIIWKEDTTDKVFKRINILLENINFLHSKRSQLSKKRALQKCVIGKAGTVKSFIALKSSREIQIWNSEIRHWARTEVGKPSNSSAQIKSGWKMFLEIVFPQHVDWIYCLNHIDSKKNLNQTKKTHQKPWHFFLFRRAEECLKVFMSILILAWRK